MLKMMYQNNKAAGDGSTRPPLTTTSNKRDLHVMAVTQLALFSDESQEKEVVYRQESLFGEADPNIGLKFGKLAVLEFIKKTKGRKRVYKCRCECGGFKSARLDNLQAGRATSCGCAMKAGGESRKRSGQSLQYDMTGQVFGDLTVLRENGQNKKGEYFWLCQCSCGGSKSVMGRSLREGGAKTHCGCKNPVPKPKNARIAKNPRNDAAFAMDIYCCYIKQGVSIRDAARSEGYKRGAYFVSLFMTHIPGYREGSIKRREESEYNKTMRNCKKKSKLFRFEKDLQETCCGILDTRGVFYKENDIEKTGFEVDILTDEYCYELKVGTRKTTLYKAMGQLLTNAQRSGLKPALVVPSDVTMHGDMEAMLIANGIEILNERTI